MKQGLLFLLIFHFSYFSGNGQSYIVGETENMHSVVLEQTLSDSELELDIDCDDIADIKFLSHSGGKFNKDWPRLSFYMDSVTDVVNNQTAPLTIYEVGETVILNSDIWTHSLDFIYGEGAMGAYGINSIENKFIVFRKKGLTDTSYAFIEISTAYTWMKIHSIISTCKSPGIVSSISNPSHQQVTLFPNPFSDIIRCGIPNVEITILNVEGVPVKSVLNTSLIDVRDLPRGIYILMIKNEDGGIQRTKMQKM